MLPEMYRVSLQAMIDECNKFSVATWNIGIRLLDINYKGMAIIRIGEFNGEPGHSEWLEYDWPENFLGSSPISPIAPAPDIRQVYAHDYGLPKLKWRTSKNLRSAHHLATFLVKSWEPVKYQEIVE